MSRARTTTMGIIVVSLTSSTYHYSSFIMQEIDVVDNHKIKKANFFKS
jgi:hypothetical protein